MITRPLLASAVEDLTKLKFPIMATQKLDGIRCLKVDGCVITRNFKKFPNNHTRTVLEKILPDGIDGEVMCPGKTFNEIQSLVMRHDGEPQFVFCAFDYVKESLDKPYIERMKDLKKWYDKSNVLVRSMVQLLLPVELNSIEDITGYESKCLDAGYEGIMLRGPQGKYKCGRSSVKEGILLKVKQFKDAEAEVIGFQEKMHNDNEAKKNVFGRTERQTLKENLRPADTLGALIVKDLTTGLEFNIGTGFDDELRKEIWTHQRKYKGKLVTYKYQDSGKKDLPRFPVFKGFRHENDL